MQNTVRFFKESKLHGLFCLHKPTNLCLKHVCPWHLISHVAIDNWCVNLNYTLVARIFVRLSTHCQNTCKSQEGWGGIYDSKLAIGESVAHYVSVCDCSVTNLRRLFTFIYTVHCETLLRAAEQHVEDSEWAFRECFCEFSSPLGE